MNSLLAVAAFVIPTAFCYYNEPLCQAQVLNDDWHAIRIVYEINGAESVSADQLAFVRTALDKAISYWSSTVSVRSSSLDTLYYKRPCGSVIGNLCTLPGLVNFSDLSDNRRYENDVLLAMANQSINTYQCGKLGPVQVDPADIDGEDIYVCGREEVSGVTTVSSDSGVAESVFGSRGCELERSIPGMPGSGKLVAMDLFLHIKLEPTRNADFFAVANRCGEDECGRPTIGGITLTRRFFDQRDMAHLTFEHEIAHILGFSIPALQKWINPNNGQHLVHPIDQGIILAWLTRSSVNDGFVESVTFRNSLVVSTYKAFHNIPVPYHAIGLVHHPNRDVDLSECRCPTAVQDRFTESDFIHCLNKSAKTCLFGIKSEHVLKASRNYYGCVGISGMELEYSSPGNAWLFNPHWKLRNLPFELMNANVLTSDDIIFVSPMTLALLKDSGWYLVNEQYGQTELVPGLHLGHMEGCDLLQRRLASPDGVATEGILRKTLLLLPYTNKEFSGNMISQGTDESHNVFSPLICSSGALSRFQIVGYESSQSYREETMRDYFQYYFCAAKSNDYHHRCVDSYWFRGDGSVVSFALCKPIICHESLLSYSIDWGGAELVVCDERQITVAIGTQYVVCADPKVVCSPLFYPHYGEESGINRIPGLKKNSDIQKGASGVPVTEKTTARSSTVDDNSNSG